jgi:hypothetical protein
MKKLCALVIAVMFCVISAVPALAIDYVQNPNYTFDNEAANTPLPLTANEIANMIAGNTPININNAAVLTLTQLQAIINVLSNPEQKPVEFRNTEMNYSIFIDPATVTDVSKLKALSLALHFDTNTAANGSIPEGAFLIIPAAGGEFGIKLTIVIGAENLTGFAGEETLALYYVNSSGVAGFMRNVDIQTDGTIKIEIDRASSYFLIPAVAGPQGPEGPQGPAGPQGPGGSFGGTGAPGSTGATGATGRPGADGTPGRDGADGAPGRDGADGAQGRDGLPGRDAVNISSDAGNSGGNNANNNRWTSERDGNPPTNAAFGIAGLTVVAGAGAVMYLFKKRRDNGFYEDYKEDYEEE